MEELRDPLGKLAVVYFGLDRGSVVFLLGGGAKASQHRDIARAAEAWRGDREMTKPWRSHDEAMGEMFRNDPAFAALYLDDVLADGDQTDLLVALRYIVNAFEVADDAKLNPKSLYRTLSPQGNPELRSLRSVLAAVGLRLSVQPIVKKPRRTRSSRSPSATAR